MKKISALVINGRFIGTTTFNHDFKRLGPFKIAVMSTAPYHIENTATANASPASGGEVYHASLSMVHPGVIFVDLTYGCTELALYDAFHQWLPDFKLTVDAPSTAAEYLLDAGYGFSMELERELRWIANKH